MQTLIDKTLRELSREYVNGHLSIDDYRDKRRRLVDQVTGINADTEAGADSTTEVEDTAPMGEVPPQARVHKTVSDRRSFPLPVILLLVAGGLSAALWFVFSTVD